MKIETRELEFSTQGSLDVKNITSMVEKEIATTSIRNGTVTLFSLGSTGGLTTIEYEPGLVKDIKEFFARLIPYGSPYHHHNTWGDDNGSSHLQSALLKTSLVVPIVEGKMTLGTWQQLVFIEFDTRSRQRTVIAQVMGQ